VLPRDRLAAAQPAGGGGLRRPLPLRPRRQGPGRVHPQDERSAVTAGEERIRAAFAAAREEGRAALMPYMMAGFPDRDSGLAVAAAYVDAGADLIELGVPFSDPLRGGAAVHSPA